MILPKLKLVEFDNNKLSECINLIYAVSSITNAVDYERVLTAFF